MHCTKKTKSNEALAHARTHTHTVTPQRCRSAFSLCTVRWVISTEKHNLIAPANLSSPPPPPLQTASISFSPLMDESMVPYIMAAGSRIDIRPQSQTHSQRILGNHLIFHRGTEHMQVLKNSQLLIKYICAIMAYMPLNFHFSTG